MKGKTGLLSVLLVLALAVVLLPAGCSNPGGGEKDVMKQETPAPDTATDKTPEQHADKKTKKKGFEPPADFKKISNFQAPSPNEVFTALAKLSGDVNWGSYCNVPDKSGYNTPEETAMNLGDRVASAFICVMARNKADTLELGRIIKNLGKGLQIEDNIEALADSVETHVEKEEWDLVRGAMDSMHSDVERELQELGDDELVTLISAGGWISGFYYVTSVLNDSYSADSSKVLAQTALVDHFIKEGKKLSSSALEKETVRMLFDGMEEIRVLIDVAPGEPVSAESVARLNEISGRINESIRM